MRCSEGRRVGGVPLLLTVKYTSKCVELHASQVTLPTCVLAAPPNNQRSLLLTPLSSRPSCRRVYLPRRFYTRALKPRPRSFFLDHPHRRHLDHLHRRLRSSCQRRLRPPYHRHRRRRRQWRSSASHPQSNSALCDR